jgi:hypothetical protein
MVKKPASAIIAAIDRVASRWTDRGYSPRVEARDAVASRTGYAVAAVDYAFDRLFGALRREPIEAVVTDELGCLEVLDHFVERNGRPPARALPLGRICVVSSRTTIGVAIAPAVLALCAKCEILVKDRDDRLVRSFFETLADELPEARDSARAQTWKGDEDAALLRDFDAVVAFGSDATLERIAGALPVRARFIGFGSKASAGYVTREALQSAAAAEAISTAAARDIVLYEGEGCLSLHVLFVERDGPIPPTEFATALDAAVRAAAGEFPIAQTDAATAARTAMARDLATFRGTALLETPFEEPPLFMPRSIAIHSVDQASEAAAYLQRHGIALEALAVTNSRSDLLELAAGAGAARVAAFGTLQAPPLGGFHGGRPRIAEFVRWLVDET